MTTPLTTLLRALTPAQRHQLARDSGTTVGYLYAIAGCHREKIAVALAIAIEDASTELARVWGTPIVTAREISTMCAIRGLDV